MATLGLTAPEKEAVEAFRRDVVEPSMTQLVVIDFWAEWCGPCKALTPILEKVTAAYADKGVVLAKIDTDKNQFIASQFQIRSIPTVYAMFQGQLVADLTSARTESQLKQMLDQLLRQLPVQPGEGAGPDIEPLIAMGEEALTEGDAARALSIFDQIADIAPDNALVAAGRVRALMALGEHDAAQTALDTLSEDAAKLPGIEQVRAALALARDAQPVDDLAGLKAEVEANPDDHDARFRLAGGQMAAGDRDGAAESLLKIVAADRSWNDDAARQQLLKLFEAVGLEDPWVLQQRRKLSAILFG
ncbi:tetratricopeptide repeat protein [Sphingomonas lacusdianchii]|uniref:tetratricopeptide repeat protein n=1 Tax=Sphingomonas lacusdianchii TaxID=2917992 RepID=UPI003D66F384